MTALGSKTAFNFTQEAAAAADARLEEQRRNNSTRFLSGVHAAAASLSGYEQPQQRLGKAAGFPRFQGRSFQYEDHTNSEPRPWPENYVVEKWLIEGEGDLKLPLLLFRPKANESQGSEGSAGPAVAIFHPVTMPESGQDNRTMPIVRELLAQGMAVACMDVSGLGLANSAGAADPQRGQAWSKTAEWGAWSDGEMTALWLGRGAVGLHAADIHRAIDFLQSAAGVDPARVGALAISHLVPAFLHSLAIERRGLRAACAIGGLASYSLAASTFNYTWPFGVTVFDALNHYDLPDLLAATALPLQIIGPVGATMQPLSDSAAAKTYGFALEEHKRRGGQLAVGGACGGAASCAGRVVRFFAAHL